MSFSAEEIRKHLNIPNLTLDVRPCVSSTNTLLKEMGRNSAPHGYVLAAAEQTAGRGRMGRSFFSPNETGVYFSILLRPSLSPSDCLLITTAAAVACARVLERYSNSKAEIKWVNDIYINDRKVCGILTEAAFTPDGSSLAFAVLGIGINLYTPIGHFPQEIQNKAGSVLPSAAEDLRCKIIAEICNEFFELYPQLTKREYITEYKSRSMLDGKPIFVLKSDGNRSAKALFIDDDLSLVVQYEDGSTEHLSTGDVSIRPL